MFPFALTLRPRLDAQSLESLARLSFVLGCLGLATYLWRMSKLTPREKNAAVAAGIVHLFLSCLIDLAAVRHEIYRSLLTRQMLWGVAFDLHLGWAALWGAGLCLAWTRFNSAWRLVFLGAFIAATLAVDILALRSGRVLEALRPDWWLYDLGALAFLAAATLFFFKCVRENRALAFRAALYALIYFAVFYVLIPALIIELGELKPFDPSALLKPWHWIAFALTAIPGAGAATQFALSGAGTPLPLDPTRRLVTRGIYAFVRNPMQLSGLLAALVWAQATGSLFMWIYVLDLFLLFQWVKRFEERELTDRFGAPYVTYARAVRKWLPRLTPYRGPRIT